MRNVTPAVRPIAALLAMSVLWGYAWSAVKIALLDCPPFLFAGLRMMLGALCLLLILRIGGRRFVPDRVTELVWLGAVQTTLLITLSTWAVARGDAGRVAFLAYTMPFFTLLMARPLLGERVRGLQWLSIALAAAGLAAIVQPWQTSAAFVSNVLAVATGFVWAIGSIMVKLLQRREPMNLVQMTAWQMFFGAVPLLVIAGLVPEGAVTWTPRFVGVLLLVSVVATGLGWLLWIYVLDHLSAGTASLGTLLAPLVAMVTSHYHFGEMPGALEMTGMGCIIAALLVLSAHSLRPAAGRPTG